MRLFPACHVLAAAFACAAAAPGADLESTLRAVERRYNGASTLAAAFEQRYLVQGRPRRVEAGSLVLRKPGRMRWQYTQPEGKLFLCDGKWIWLYTPAGNQVERAKLKEADDFRAPLAFLLGRLNFHRTFGGFELRTTPDGPALSAWPKDGRMPFTRVDFTLSPDFAIRRLLVHSSDGTAMEFLFAGERLNVAASGALFRFQAPPGARIVETGN